MWISIATWDAPGFWRCLYRDDEYDTEPSGRSARTLHSISGGTKQLCLAKWIPALNLPLFRRNIIQSQHFISDHPSGIANGGRAACLEGSGRRADPFSSSGHSHICSSPLNRPDFCPHEGKVWFIIQVTDCIRRTQRHFQHIWEYVIQSLVFLS